MFNERNDLGCPTPLVRDDNEPTARRRGWGTPVSLLPAKSQRFERVSETVANILEKIQKMIPKVKKEGDGGRSRGRYCGWCTSWCTSVSTQAKCLLAHEDVRQPRSEPTTEWWGGFATRPRAYAVCSYLDNIFSNMVRTSANSASS
jgi:hypothetical protein